METINKRKLKNLKYSNRNEKFTASTLAIWKWQKKNPGNLKINQ